MSRGYAKKDVGPKLVTGVAEIGSEVRGKSSSQSPKKVREMDEAVRGWEKSGGPGAIVRGEKRPKGQTQQKTLFAGLKRGANHNKMTKIQGK